MSTNPDKVPETNTTYHSMSRRTFLRWSAHLAKSMVVLSSVPFIAAPTVRGGPQSNGYGTGPYGEGTYRGRSGYAIHLPIVARKEN
jgi:hypothetical protein